MGEGEEEGKRGTAAPETEVPVEGSGFFTTEEKSGAITDQENGKAVEFIGDDKGAGKKKEKTTMTTHEEEDSSSENTPPGEWLLTSLSLHLRHDIDCSLIRPPFYSIKTVGLACPLPGFSCLPLDSIPLPKTEGIVGPPSRVFTVSAPIFTGCTLAHSCRSVEQR